MEKYQRLTHFTTTIVCDSDKAHEVKFPWKHGLGFNCHQIRATFHPAGQWWWMKATHMQNVFVVEYCESKIAVVSDVMTHVRYDVFCSSYWKKDVEFWLLTLEASDFTHSWACQTECIQAIRDKCVNRPVVHRSEVTPWQLYSVWDRSHRHPQWFASAYSSFFFCLNFSLML